MFEELKRYTGFTQEDERLLHEMRPEIMAHADAITESFYARIQQHSNAARLLRDEEQVSRLRQTLRLWLEKVLTGPYDVEYYELRSRIGRAHVAVGLQQYYMLGAMNEIRNHLHRILLGTFGRSDRRLGPRLAALNKILDIELAIMLESYRDDLLARLRAEEQVRNRGSLESLQTMVASLAHEIRNPLNSTSLQLTLLERRLTGPGGDQVTLKRVGVIREEVQRLERLLSDFIDFARPQRLKLERVSLNHLLAEVVKQHEVRAARQKVRIHIVLDTRLGEILVDPGRMKEVASNLLANALDALPGGGNVWVESRLDNGKAVFQVKDDGSGLPAGLQIFDPFVTTKVHGTGLGLSIASNIVHLHQGKISGQNTFPGACFRVELPFTITQ